MSVQKNGSQEEPCDLMASGLGGSGLSTEIKEPLLANHVEKNNVEQSSTVPKSQSIRST